MLSNQKAVAAKKVSYFESEDFLKMKAFEIRSRIVMYQNLGLTREYQMAQQEGADVVAKYQKILAQKNTQALEDQVNQQLGLDTSA